MRVVPAGTPATQPVSVDYASDYDIARQSGTLTKGQLRTGKSVISVSGTYDSSGASTVLHMKLDAPSVPLQDIQALLPAFGVTLPAGSSLQGGTLKTNLLVNGAVDKLATTGSITVSDAKLAGFGLGSKLGALAAFTGLKPSQDTLIQLLSSNLGITPSGMAFNSMNLVVPDLGTVTGEGTIGANQALNFKMRAQISSERRPRRDCVASWSRRRRRKGYPLLGSGHLIEAGDRAGCGWHGEGRCVELPGPGAWEGIGRISRIPWAASSTASSARRSSSGNDRLLEADFDVAAPLQVHGVDEADFR